MKQWFKTPSAADLYKAPPKPPVTPRTDQPPQPPKRTALPSGPKRYRLEARGIIIGGPGEPPPGFVTGTTSKVEWYWYWAMTKLKGPEGPSSGWAYQDSAAGGRTLPGGSILDFLVFDQVPRLAIRIQTDRFHQAFGARQIIYDTEQMITLNRLGYEVVNTWSQDWQNDASGQAVIAACKKILYGGRERDPIATANSIVRA